MRKIISILLLFAVIFVVGCNTTETPVETESNDQETTEATVAEEENEEASEKEVEEETSDASENEKATEILDPDAFVPFQGVDFKGNEVSNDIFKENQLTLIKVWATNCPPCIEEIPHLQELNDELADEGFQIIGFLVGGEGSKDEAVEILDMLDADFMNLIVPEDVFRLLRVQYTPTSFLVDSKGNVVEERTVGALTKERYLEKINKYLQ